MSQHADAKPGTARAAAYKTTDLRLECLPHLAFSPDLALVDFPGKKGFDL